jgi:hypothetical protein
MPTSDPVSIEILKWVASTATLAIVGYVIHLARKLGETVTVLDKQVAVHETRIQHLEVEFGKHENREHHAA